jgi:hypothetical protein
MTMSNVFLDKRPDESAFFDASPTQLAMSSKILTAHHARLLMQ